MTSISYSTVNFSCKTSHKQEVRRKLGRPTLTFLEDVQDNLREQKVTKQKENHKQQWALVVR
jgi:hypothetical protein